jgi:hypothetical protein
VHLELRGQAVCEKEVQEEEEEIGDAEKGGRLHLREQADGEDALVAHFLEPEPVREKSGCSPEAEEQDGQDDHHQEALGIFHRREDCSEVDHNSVFLFLCYFSGLRATVTHYRGLSPGCQGACRLGTLDGECIMQVINYTKGG